MMSLRKLKIQIQNTCVGAVLIIIVLCVNMFTTGQ